MFDWDWNWRKIVTDMLIFASTSPWQFVYYVLLILSPFFAISAYLAWQLAKEIEAKEKDKKKNRKKANMAKEIEAKEKDNKKKNRKEANMAKLGRQKAD